MNEITGRMRAIRRESGTRRALVRHGDTGGKQMKRTGFLVGMLLALAGVAQAGTVTIPGAKCEAVHNASRVYNNFATHSYTTTDMQNPQYAGSSSYVDCNFDVPASYGGANSSSMPTVIEWETDSTDTTNYFCPAVSSIRVLPKNASVNDSTTGTILLSYPGTAQVSTGQYHVMQTATISTVHMINRQTGTMCDPTDTYPCGGASAHVYIFWQDCIDPPFNTTNIGGAALTYVKVKRILISGF